MGLQTLHGLADLRTLLVAQPLSRARKKASVLRTQRETAMVLNLWRCPAHAGQFSPASASESLSPTSLHRALEVDAHAPLGNARLFANAVHPVFLRASAHDDQIAGAGLERHGVAAVARGLIRNRRVAERKHRHDAFGASAGEPIAMPARAVCAPSR